MDKLFSSSWFIKVLSFIVALMLYTVVSSEQNLQSNQSLFMETADGEEIATFTEELAARYDEGEFVVKGLPDKVTIRMKGTKEAIQKAGWNITKDAFIDLTEKGPGKYRVKVKTEGFPDDVVVNVIPAYVNVTILEKVSQTYPVQMDVINREELPDGYKLGEPEASPKEVKVTGGKRVVESVAYIKGVVDAKGAIKDIEGDVLLNAYDKHGNQLDLTIEPATVDVTLPVISPSKEMKVPVKTVNSLPDGMSIRSISVNKVKVFGNKEQLAELKELKPIEVDLSSIEGDTTLEVDLEIPDGLKKIEPNTVKVEIDVAPTETKIFTDVPIEVRGKNGSNTAIDFVIPENRTVNMTLTGAGDVLKEISRSEVDAYIDVKDLSQGTDTVEIQVESPKYINTDLSIDEATIERSDT